MTQRLYERGTTQQLLSLLDNSVKEYKKLYMNSEMYQSLKEITEKIDEFNNINVNSTTLSEAIVLYTKLACWLTNNIATICLHTIDAIMSYKIFNIIAYYVPEVKVLTDTVIFDSIICEAIKIPHCYSIKISQKSSIINRTSEERIANLTNCKIKIMNEIIEYMKYVRNMKLRLTEMEKYILTLHENPNINRGLHENPNINRIIYWLNYRKYVYDTQVIDLKLKVAASKLEIIDKELSWRTNKNVELFNFSLETVYAYSLAYEYGNDDSLFINNLYNKLLKI